MLVRKDLPTAQQIVQACHAVLEATTTFPSQVSSHPNLVDGDPATPDNVAKILENGFSGSMGQMPNATTNGLSNQDIANLVAYLNTLK